MMNFETAMQHVDESLHCVVDKGDHYVITYHYMTPETFRDSDGNICPIRTQFRGICFDKETGECVRLPFHKFFNYGEVENTEFNFDEDFYMMAKLDGSLVAPYLVGDRLIWGTKSGETDMSQEILDVLAELPYWDGLYDFVLHMLTEGFTPMFEYVSPKNRIVVKYDQPDIVLIGVRCIKTGRYMSPDKFRVYNATRNIPIVNMLCIKGDEIIERVRGWEDAEGVVLYQNQNFIKLKSLWYVQLHKNKELIEHEKNVVELILDDNVDDVLPLLQEDQKERLLTYVSEFWSSVNRVSSALCTGVTLCHRKYETRKDFGLATSRDGAFLTNPVLKTLVFKFFDDQGSVNDDTIRNEFVGMMRKSLTSTSKYDMFKEQNGLTYSTWSM